jgi:hypothetical protein
MFEPTKAMHDILERLQLTVDNLHTQSSSMTKEAAMSIVDDTINELNLLYTNLRKGVENGHGEAMFSEMGWNFNFSQEIMINIAQDMLNEYQQFKELMTLSYPFERTYMQLGVYLFDLYDISLKVRSSFVTMESTIYAILREEILMPYLDLDFKKVVPSIRYEKKEKGSCYHLPPEAWETSEIKVIQKAQAFLEQLQHANYSKLQTISPTFYEAFQDKLDECSHGLETFNLLNRKVLLMIENYKEGERIINGRAYPLLDLQYLMENFKNLLALSKHAENINSELNALKKQAEQIIFNHEYSQKLNKLIGSKKPTTRGKRKATPPIKQQPVTISPLIEEVLPVVERPLPKISSPVQDLSKHLSTLSLSCSKDHIEGPKVKAAPYVPHFAAQKTVVSKKTTEPSPYIFKSRSRKTLEAVFSGTNKVKYADLKTLVENALSGDVKSDTGSSSRKMTFGKHKVFLHQRHGRDRKKYVDPNVIKDVRNILKTLGVTPETYQDPSVTSSQSNSSTLK